ncbi:Oidioi.mRNA.OKI2018_I69.chr2.g5151.t1.cds [Oikopleura dioica]|uniref:Oidioi.mRNA.OKI2018_I69.chr2.g5151.t1.cds n=1 Tax=Oikopleura dioica TaxID=34765 RepID=A0ABN7SZ36_OIKDI|nr:Oidioi.mRNA.OKI2018_I69.chr2.g5151.t1.cds [Oikopleura dioica]
MPRQVSTHQIENSPRPGRANYQQSPAVKRRESRRYSEAQLEEIIHGLNNENESKPNQRHSGKTDKSYKSGKSKKAKKKKKVEKVSESENTVFREVFLERK